MPLIRYTFPRDVRERGDQPIQVPDVTARTLLNRRRAVLVTEDELAQLTKQELAEVAEQAGADVRKRDSKGHFIKAITDAEGP